MSTMIESTCFGSMADLAKAIAGNNANSKPKSEYYACGGCKREFFSLEEFNNHTCKNGKRASAEARAMVDKTLKQGIFSGMSSSGASAMAEAIANKAEYMNDVLKAASAANGGANGGMDVDIRMAAVKEVTDMKTEMIRAGIPCNTMNAEETKKAYQEFKAAKSVATSASEVTNDDNLGNDDEGAKRPSPSKRIRVPRQ